MREYKGNSRKEKDSEKKDARRDDRGVIARGGGSGQGFEKLVMGEIEGYCLGFFLQEIIVC